jgi:hypothetical protein
MKFAIINCAVALCGLWACASVDPQIKKAIKEQHALMMSSLQKTDTFDIAQFATDDGRLSLERHFTLKSKTDFQEFREFLETNDITGFELIDETGDVKVYLGEYNKVTGRVALLYRQASSQWKIHKYLAGK